MRNRAINFGYERLLLLVSREHHVVAMQIGQAQCIQIFLVPNVILLILDTKSAPRLDMLQHTWRAVRGNV